MRKLIKKYQGGGESSFAREKMSGYPNTNNVGANALGIDFSSPASANLRDILAPLENSALDNILPKSNGSPISLGNIKGLNKNIFSQMGKGLFNNLGGTSGLISMGSNIASSLLPEATQSKGLGIANNILSMAENIPVYGKFATLAKFGINALNSLGGHTIASLKNDQYTQETLAGTGGGYGDFMNTWDDAKKFAGKRAGLFDGSTYDDKVYEANRQLASLQGIIGKKKQDDLLTAQMEDRWNERTMMDMNGGLGNVLFGRLGLKVEILPKVHAILNRPKVVDTLKEFEEEIPEFKEGGKMNVIPEGALHARLHHMENAEGLTKKGIPVVSIAEGGEMEQQAEIELNEIIFNLEVTTELEKLMQDGSDNAAIEAGKLLVKEIFENTDDRTGLIDKLTGGELSPEEAALNHQVFQEGGTIKPKFEDWLQTVPEDRRDSKDYNLKRAFELAPWEQLEKWRKASPEQLEDEAFHLNTFYWNKEGVGEFVKKNGHPTLIKELQFYFGENPKSKEFREKYNLDMSGEYFKYIKK